MKLVLSVIVDNSVAVGNVEKILTEEPETKDDDSEWKSQVNESYDNVQL